MVRPFIEYCPSCKTSKNCLELRHRVQEDDLGNKKYRGSLYACRCGALTLSIGGVLNLRNEVAEEYGVIRVEDRPPVVAVPPVVRRRA